MWLRIYLNIVVIFTFFLLIAGGMVTSTGSGLAVPDWPLSYGQLMPPMVGGIFYEHGHRMIASFVGLLTVILTVWVWRTEKRQWVRRLAVGALGAVILQGALGGLTVILLLPTAVSASHATLAQSFFCMVIALAFVNSRWWMDREHDTKTFIPLAWIVVPVGAVLIQLMFGALMRHSQAGLAVPDFPLAYGGFFPDLGDESLRSYTDELVRLDLRLWADGQITAWQIGIHLAHRYWAYAVTAILLWFAKNMWGMKQQESRFRLLAWAIVVVVIVQVSLGIATVLLGRPVLLATAHQSVGAGLLGVTFLASLHLVRLRNAAMQKADSSPVELRPEGVHA